MKKIFLFLLISSLFLFSGCSSDSMSQSSEEFSNSTVEKISLDSKNEVKTLDFVDAHGEWYTMTVNENVQKHSYNWDYLTNDEMGISYEGDENYTIRKGIDVSYYQGNIDWNKIKAAGYDFAFIRIGVRGYGEEGTLMEDANFHTNIQNAQAAGIDVGVYFFAQAINEEEAVEEANFVLHLLQGYSLQLPVVYDPELIRHDDARTDHVTGEQFTQNTIAFCEAVKAAGYDSMIYSNLVWEATLFDMEKLQEYPFWYADYEKVPQTPYQFSIWQYSETGTVDGINGKVDLNIQFVQN